MAKYEIRLWAEDIDEHDHPEIAIEFYEDEDLQAHAWVRLHSDGTYKIRGELGRDEEVLTLLALAFRTKVAELAGW
ncbi:hypothetical protein AO067_04040 [Pseudomonas viridiflava ICMP 13104]|uniref:Uncharacterized protein n=1 Tax=Pseudomonas viridiflava ICMP 13104 TaxID=1198305 RepID=A0A0W0IAM6_PSEVI|nr:hypothetical protein [Pseudomonas syringae]KTB69874.1 hypothetical protein AO067_04040 [Pseudomonas viridiflava ICMP 13104]KTB80582.1 hypothetical protein AO070_19210 [Pseudomonas syringae pv. syringae PD2766]